MIKIIMITIVSLIIGCAGTGSGLKTLAEPEPNTIIVCGTILVENLNRDLPFSYWDRSFEVTVMGKDDDGTIRHFSVQTDYEGYYCLPQLPRCHYVLKSVSFQEPGYPPFIIVNDLEASDSKFYLMKHPERGIKYNMEWFSLTPPEKVINHNITWFGLLEAVIADMSEKTSGEVIVKNIRGSLESQRFWANGYLYKREDPVVYFKNKFPNSSWWHAQ